METVYGQFGWLAADMLYIGLNQRRIMQKRVGNKGSHIKIKGKGLLQNFIWSVTL